MSKNILAVALVVLVFAVGILIGNFTAGGDSQVGQVFGSATDSLQNATDNNSSDGGQGGSSEVAFTISAQDLTESQRQMLSAMGVSETEIAVTYDMLACAEAKLGAARMDEIRNGATPSFSEGAQLLGCY